MRLLFRMAFWLTVVVLLLPTGGTHTSPSSLVMASDAISAAKATLADAQSFCARQPEACAIGSQTAVALGHRAQAGAKMIYEYLSEHLGPENDAAYAGKLASLPSGRISRDTLTALDLVPPWRGPRPRKDASLERP